MTIELYAAPVTDPAQAIDSPISNTTGTLPDHEPALDLKDLVGTFDSREEAIAYIQRALEAGDNVVVDSHRAPFDDYTHVESLTISIRNRNQSTERRHYYLVTDEGY